MSRTVLFAATAWLFLAGVVIQVFLAGAGLFGLTDWNLHTDVGWGLGSGVLFVLVAAYAAGTERRTLVLAIALSVSGCVQPELAEARTVAPLVAALHPVNALLLFWLAWLVARRALDEARRPGLLTDSGAADGALRFPAGEGPGSLEDGTRPPV